MLSAGFVEGKPMICVKSPAVPQTCLISGFFANKASPLLHQTFDKLNRPPTVTEAAAALKAEIEKTAETDRAAGGPISILRLSNAALPQWLTQPPSDNGIEKICDVVRERRAEIAPLVDRPNFDLRLNAACPK
jgi:hypothetical protein